MSSRSLYPIGPVQDKDGNVSPAYQQVFTLWGSFVTAGRQAGATADRPTSGLWVGRQWFDTTLGYPVWVKQVNPTVVWVNASGIAV